MTHTRARNFSHTNLFAVIVGLLTSLCAGRAAAQTVTITASNKALGKRSVTLTITPPSEPLAIGALALQPPGVFGGNDTTGVVTLAPGYVAPAADTVNIQRAEYTVSSRTLRVETTSTRTDATLQAFVTASGQIIGTLINNGGGKYSGQLNWATKPQNITVSSSYGGAATSAVILK